MIISRQKIFFDYSQFDAKDAEELKKLRSAKAKYIMAKRKSLDVFHDVINYGNKSSKGLIKFLENESKNSKNPTIPMDRKLADEIIKDAREVGFLKKGKVSPKSIAEGWDNKYEIRSQFERLTNYKNSNQLSPREAFKLLEEVNKKHARQELEKFHEITGTNFDIDWKIKDIIDKNKNGTLEQLAGIDKTKTGNASGSSRRGSGTSTTRSSGVGSSGARGGSSRSVTYISPSEKTKAINRTHKNLSRSFGRNSKLAAAGALGLGLVGGGYYALKD